MDFRLVQGALMKIGREALPKLEAVLADENISSVLRERVKETLFLMSGE